MAIQKYKGHLALLGAAIMWGLMSPIGKTALSIAAPLFGLSGEYR